VLTHLLGQTVEVLEAKIAAYRAAWAVAGHPGRGHVTLMLHTFVGDDLEQVRRTVREPFSAYLWTCADLLRGLAPAVGLDPDRFGEADLEAIVAHACDRYFSTCALFGTVESCARMVERLQAAGVDEIACLIDFGVETEQVLESLDRLRRLLERSREAPAQPAAPKAGRERAEIRRELAQRRAGSLRGARGHGRSEGIL
jgi:natural product biosynthesis luciferase-like monooxygenase protein